MPQQKAAAMAGRRIAATPITTCGRNARKREMPAAGCRAADRNGGERRVAGDIFNCPTCQRNLKPASGTRFVSRPTRGAHHPHSAPVLIAAAHAQRERGEDMATLRRRRSDAQVFGKLICPRERLQQTPTLASVKTGSPPRR